MSQEVERVRRAHVRPFQSSFFAILHSLIDAYIAHNHLDSGKTAQLHKLKRCRVYKQLPDSPGNSLQTDLFLLREIVEALQLVIQQDRSAALALLCIANAKAESDLKNRVVGSLSTNSPYPSCVTLFFSFARHLARLLGDTSAEESFQLSYNGSRENRLNCPSKKPKQDGRV